MAHVPDTVSDPALRGRLKELQDRLAVGLESVDSHHRLAGRPVSYEIISGQTLQIVYRDVPSIAEAELLGVKRLLGDECFCTIAPQTAETITVRFVVPLKRR